MVNLLANSFLFNTDKARNVKESKHCIWLCGFGQEIQTQNSNISNINEVMMQTQNYLLFSQSE